MGDGYTHTCLQCGALLTFRNSAGELTYAQVSGPCPCGQYAGVFFPVPRPARDVLAQTVKLTSRSIH